MSIEESEACQDKCNGNGTDRCCLKDCMFFTADMFVNGIINSEELFKFFGDNKGDNMEDDSNFDEAWSPITEKSTQKCLDMSNYIFIMQSVVFLII